MKLYIGLLWQLHPADTYFQSGGDWDKISGRETSHSSRPVPYTHKKNLKHRPTTNSETWATLLDYLYDHYIKIFKSLVRVVGNN